MSDNCDCDACKNGISGIYKRIVTTIGDDRDVFVVMVGGDDFNPPFAYTIGMKDLFNQPDIIMFGIGSDTLGVLLNNFVNVVRKNGMPSVGDPISDIIERFDVVLCPFIYKEKYFKFTSWYYKSWDFDVLQLVWPDEKNIFPWENGFNGKFIRNQPHARD